MKQLFLFLTLAAALVTDTAQAQIGLGTATPHPSAAVDIPSTTGGFLLPRMTSAQRSAIAAPAQGLIVYDTDSAALMIFSNTAWTRIALPGWNLKGNAGTTANDFIGTTDAQPLRFRVNNQPSGVIDLTLQNTAFGYQPLPANTTGTFNTAHGYHALNANTNGSGNTALGAEALLVNTSGSSNAAINGLRSNTTGNQNVSVGTFSLYSNTGGNKNTALGNSSLYSNVSGSQNTALGSSADLGAASLTNATAIGANARVDASNSLVLGSIAGVNLATQNTKVGIGTTTPQQTLHVKGTMQVDTLGTGAATDDAVTVDANGVLRRRATTATASGWGLSGNAGTTASNFIGTTDNVALQFRVNNEKSGTIDPANLNTAIGYEALKNNTSSGLGNSAVGDGALKANTTGTYNTANGRAALGANIGGSSNTALGVQALGANTGGGSNVAVGLYAAQLNTTGDNNTATGNFSLNQNTTGDENTAIGRSTLGANTTGNRNTALGAGADVGSGALSNATAIGAYSKVDASYSLVLGATANASLGVLQNTKVGIGTTTPQQALHVKGQVRVDTLGAGAATDSVMTVDANGVLHKRNAAAFAGSSNGWGLSGNAGTTASNFIGTSDNQPLRFGVNNQKAGLVDSSLYNTALGYQALNANTTGSSNTANGFQALQSNTTGFSNTANGVLALQANTTGTSNTATGTSALLSNTSGRSNTADGFWALKLNTTGENNTAAGYQSLLQNTTGFENVASGKGSLSGNKTGSFNTSVGTEALNGNISGQLNTALGWRADVGDTALSYATAIGAQARVDASYSLVLGAPAAPGQGRMENTKVGIGTTTPQQALHINGKVRIDTLNTGTATDDVITIDANGVLGRRATTSSGATYTAGSGISISGSNVISATDNSATNEIQNLVLNGTQLSLTGTAAQPINLPTFALPYSGSSAGGTTGVFSITSTGTAAAVEGNSSSAVGVNATTATGTALKGVATGAGTALYAEGAIQLKTTGAANGKYLMATDANGTAQWATIPSGGTNYWTLNGNDISNNNTGMVLVGTSSPTTSGVMEVTKNGPMGTVAAFKGGTAGYMNVLNVSENGLSGNPAGCDVCTGAAAIKATAINGDALFARSTNGRGIYLKGGNGTSYPAMLIETNTGANNALEMTGKIKIADGTQGLNKVLTSDASGVASWQTISGGGSGGGTLDAAYNFGGSGAGRTITASNGAVKVVGTDGLLVTGSYASGASPEISGGGTRMFFNPQKSVFRAGTISGNQWDAANMGDYSTGMGYDATASGMYSTAIGYNVVAFGVNSTAFGQSTVANNPGSTAMGYFTNALGNVSTAMGYATTAPSFVETVIGSYNTNYTPSNTSNWVSTDRLFVIGNGTGIASRSDALIVYKSGNATLSGTLTQSSDRRLKRNIKPLENSLDKVLRLNGYRYQWNQNLNKGDAQQIGFVAQEVEALFPELVTTDAKGMKSVAYQNLVPVLVEAIKELKAENDALKNSNAELKADNSSLNARSADVEARLSQIEKLLNANAKLVKE